MELSAEQAQTVVDKIFSGVAAIHVEPMAEEVSVSMGVVLFQPGLDFDSACRMADHGVYESKNNKGSTFILK